MDDAVLVGGTIQAVRFSEDKQQVSIDIGNSPCMTMEFRNSRKNRADMVRKMRFAAGEQVIAIGKMTKNSQVLAYGWDIQREGGLSEGYYCMLKGVVTRIFQASESVIDLKLNDKSSILLTTTQSTWDLKTEDELTCLCYRRTRSGCMKSCPDRSIRKCRNCMNQKNEKNYYVLQIERNQ